MSSALDKSVQIGIGSPVWIFDQNHRVYGSKNSAPIWRKYWREYKIEAETSRSWVIGRGWAERKIPKNGRMPMDVCFSEAEIDRRAFVVDHAYRISEEVRKLSDYDKLKQIAEMVGYKAKD